MLACIIALLCLPPSLPLSIQPLTDVQRGHTIVLSSASMTEEAFAVAVMLGSSWVRMEPAVQVCERNGGKRKKEKGRQINEERE